MPEQKRLALSGFVTDYIVYTAIHDDEFLKSVRQILPARVFDSSAVEHCVTICYDFFDKYQRAPKDVFIELVKDRKAKMDETEFNLLKMYLKQLATKDMSEHDREYVMDRLNKELVDLTFCRNIDSIRDLANDGKIEEAKSVALGSFRSVLPTSSGAMDYFEDFSVALDRNFEEDFMMPTGHLELDKLIGGFKKQNFICWFGPYKGGKTWCLQHMAKTALMHGLNVYHASFEVPQGEMQLRYDQMFGRLVNAPSKREIEMVVQDDHRRPIIVQKEMPSVYDRAEWTKAREKMSKYGGKLMIEKFPPYTGASILDIEDRIVYYEQAHGIKFDIVITDYADLMKPIDGRKDTRDQLNITYMLHKMLADKYNMTVFTVSQVQRGAIEAPIIKMNNLAEDIRKAANADACIAICRSAEDKARHFKRLFVAGGRGFADGVGCGAYDNLGIGQWSEWSVPFNFAGDDD